jgi:hypothetical protein
MNEERESANVANNNKGGVGLTQQENTINETILMGAEDSGSKKDLQQLKT